MQTNTKNIFKDGSLFDVHVSQWTACNGLTPQDMGLAASDIETDAYDLGTKKLMPKEVMDRFRKIEGRARRAADDLGFPFPIGSAKFVPRTNIQTIIDRLKGYKEDFRVLVEDLVNNFELYRQQMIPTYRRAAEKAYFQQKSQKPVGESVPTFSMDNTNLTLEGDATQDATEKEAYIQDFLNRIQTLYPSVESLAGKFGIDFTLFEVGETTSEFATDEWKEQARTKIGGFIDDVVAQLRGEAVDICGRVASAIKEGKVIRTSTIESLSKFIDKFQNMNFVGDKVVEDQLNQLKADFLTNHTAEQLSEPEMQTELKKRLNLISEAAANISDRSSVSGGYRKKIAWEG